jgi:hypothetical protein
MKEMVALTKGLTNQGLEAFRCITQLYADACVTKASDAGPYFIVLTVQET